MDIFDADCAGNLSLHDLMIAGVYIENQVLPFYSIVILRISQLNISHMQSAPQTHYPHTAQHLSPHTPNPSPHSMHQLTDRTKKGIECDRESESDDGARMGLSRIMDERYWQKTGWVVRA